MRLKLTVLLVLLLAAFTTAAAQALRDVPDNDNIIDARQITIGKTYTVSDIGAATTEFGELTASCNGGGELYNTVWFKFTAPVYGKVYFSTDGSAYYGVGVTSMNTSVVVYGEFNPGEITEVACEFATYAEGTFNIDQNVTYYVGAGTDADIDYLSNSILKFKTRMIRAEILPDNFSFETPIGSDNWKFKAKGGIGAGETVCNDVTYPAYHEDCAFRITANLGNNIKLTQTSPWPKTFVARKGAMVRTGVALRVQDTGLMLGVKITVTLTYTDGTPPTKVVHSLDGIADTMGEVLQFVPIPLASSKPATITYQLSFKTDDGTLMIDKVVYDYFATASTRDSAILPPPAAAQ